MEALLQQESRPIRITTQLAEDALVVEKFHAVERVSAPFNIQLTLLSQEQELDVMKLMGSPASVAIRRTEDEDRIFNGVIASISSGDVNRDGWREYKAEVVPWLWFLGKRHDCRIFQGKTVVEIVQEVFKGLGFHDFRIGQMLLEHEPREYCVQYRESDLDFVHRLLEEEGIFYFFEHSETNHVLVLSDTQAAFKPCEEYNSSYIPGASNSSAIRQWEHQYQYCSGLWSQSDYNYLTPSSQMMAESKTLLDIPNIQSLEFYDYPGKHEKVGQGKNISKIRIEEQESKFHTVQGMSDCGSFCAGLTFKMAEHSAPGEVGKEYVVLSIEHIAVDNSYRSEEDSHSTAEKRGNTGYDYHNTFECMESSMPYRPERVTPEPKIHGTQTAEVVGPAGEEIYTDDNGRIKVQFHWDRLGKTDENSSCWIRVAHSSAGKGWGQASIPRIGQEVVVIFLEGDPDRPLVIGSVYNADLMPPFGYPAGKTQSGMKSRSSPGGNSSNYNEVRMNDAKGQEELSIQAEKDYNANIKNNMATTVAVNQSESVGVNKSVSVGSDFQETTGSNKSVTVGAVETHNIGADRALSIGANDTISVGADQSTNISSNQTVIVGSKQTENIGSKKSLSVGTTFTEMVGAAKMSTVGGALQVNVGAVMNETVGGARLSEVGAYSLEAVGGNKTVTVGGDLTIEVSGKITIKSGAAEIVLEGGNVAIKGNMIDLN